LAHGLLVQTWQYRGMRHLHAFELCAEEADWKILET
jgi:hypothetical protein